MSTLTKFLAWIIREHIVEKERAARQAGYQEATKKIGKQLKDRQNDIVSLTERLAQIEKDRTWIIRDDRTVPDIHADMSIYGPKRLPVTLNLQQQMRDAVAQLVWQGKLSMPTEEQWAMILNDYPATCVVAGAGSGKSTTLVLRVVFLACYLGIPLSKITVVSFTRKSCKELREKIVEKLSLAPWNGRLKESDSQSLEDISRTLVSTFHAALNRMAKKVFPNVQWFDVIGEKHHDEEEIDNPVGMVKLDELQIELLKEAYIHCYQGNSDFQKHIDEMMRIEADKSSYGASGKDGDVETAKKASLSPASNRDLALVKLVNERFTVIARKLKLNWPVEGLDLTPVCLTAMNTPHVFYANGTISKTGRPIFLSLNGMLNRESLFLTGEKIGDGEDAFPVLASGKVRRMIIKTYYGGNALDIRSTKDITRLNIDVLRGSATSSAPRFLLQLDGETSGTDILEALYDQGSFIENLGIEVQYLLGKCELKSGSLEYRFASALALFWKTFEEILREKNILTFNRAFITLAQAGHDKFRSISPAVFEPFTHLLIDEFQDISPQIVDWLKNIQSYISSRNGDPTIEAIGDDWQSIYGWRGSAPQVFINFHDHFPVHTSLGRQNQLMMMTNFRSVGPIVSDAERILAPIEIKIDKKANCFQQVGPGDHGVILKIADSSDIEGESIIVDEIIKQMRFARNMQNADKNHVLVLSRTNQVKNKIKASVENRIGEHFGIDSPIQFMTYHQAKGLQGEVAVLCEDCVSGDPHTLRNAIYKSSGLFPNNYTYDLAMVDEAYRLGYVGVTRGIRRVLWLVKEAKGASRFFVEAIHIPKEVDKLSV